MPVHFRNNIDVPPQSEVAVQVVSAQASMKNAAELLEPDIESFELIESYDSPHVRPHRCRITVQESVHLVANE